MLFHCYSHYSFLSQNNISKQRNGLSRERRGSAARAGQLHALLCLLRGSSELPVDANGRLPGRWQFPVFQAILLPQRRAWQCLPDSPQWCFLGASFGFAQLAAGLAEKRLLSFFQRGSLNTSEWLPATRGTCSRPAGWKGALAGTVLLPFSVFVTQLDQKRLLVEDAPLKEREGKPLGK